MTHRSTNPNSILMKLALLVGFAALGCGLTGCVTDDEPIQVHLENRTQERITARIVLQRIGDSNQTLARAVLQAGDSKAMGPFAPPSNGSIKLVLQRDDQFSDVPTRKRLRPGYSSWKIVSPVFNTYSSIELQPATHSEQAWTSVPARRGLILNNK